MAEFGPAQSDQKGYRQELNRQIVDVDESVVVVLRDGQALTVAIADSTVASVVSVSQAEPRGFSVKGLKAFGEAFLEAKDGDGTVRAYINIGVGPIHAAFGPATAGQPGFEADGSRQTVDFNGTADIVLNQGAGLVVTSNDTAAVTVNETTSAGGSGPRTFTVKGLKSQGHAVLMASAPPDSGTVGGTYAFLSVVVGKGIEAASATSATPNGQTTAAQALGEVPQELVDEAEKGSLPLTGKPSFWTDQQGKLAFKYFLYAVQQMRSHAMPLRSGVLLVAQAGVETSYGKLGGNPAHNNFLSFQPPASQAQQLRDAGIPIVIEDRVNSVGGKPQPTPVPDYKDIPQSIRLHIEVALPQLFPSLLALLKDSNTTGDRYGATADAVRYGALYVAPPGADPKTTTSYADELRRSTAYIKAMLQGLPRSLSDGTRTWAQQLAMQL